MLAESRYPHTINKEPAAPPRCLTLRVLCASWVLASLRSFLTRGRPCSKPYNSRSDTRLYPRFRICHSACSLDRCSAAWALTALAKVQLSRCLPDCSSPHEAWSGSTDARFKRIWRHTGCISATCRRRLTLSLSDRMGIPGDGGHIARDGSQ